MLLSVVECCWGLLSIVAMLPDVVIDVEATKDCNIGRVIKLLNR